MTPAGLKAGKLTTSILSMLSYHLCNLGLLHSRAAVPAVPGTPGRKVEVMAFSDSATPAILYQSRHP